MVDNEKKPPKPLKVNSNVGPEEIKAKQKENNSLKKYWDLVGKPVEVEKPQFLRDQKASERPKYWRRSQRS